VASADDDRPGKTLPFATKCLWGYRAMNEQIFQGLGDGINA
jgi:hypothetical protein